MQRRHEGGMLVMELGEHPFSETFGWTDSEWGPGCPEIPSSTASRLRDELLSAIFAEETAISKSKRLMAQP
ncbi:MAG: hypothetical protein ACI87E_003515 [Mariniblastus sp.]|jgi:hypothetical protein